MSLNDPILTNLLQSNEKWARAVTEADPDFFPQSAEKPQEPQVLWIGCSDSRVPESVVTASKPGDLFVHRNIANQVHPGDDSVLSVLAYAVDYLKVKHVIVVGHSNCGGAAACVKAVSTPPQETNTPLLRWLTPLANLARELKVDSLKPDEALSLLVKENVRKQVKNLFESETISKARARGQLVRVHGWIYELSTGKLVDLEMPEPLHPYGK